MCVQKFVCIRMHRGTWVTYLGRGHHREQQWEKFNFLVAIEERAGAWLNRCDCKRVFFFPLIQPRLYNARKNGPPEGVFPLTLFYVLKSVCVCVSKAAAAEFSRYKKSTVVSLKNQRERKEREWVRGTKRKWNNEATARRGFSQLKRTAAIVFC